MTSGASCPDSEMVLEKPAELTSLQGGISGHLLGWGVQWDLNVALKYLSNFTTDV